MCAGIPCIFISLIIFRITFNYNYFFCRSIASEKNITMASVINMQALKIMSERLPETEADMMSIPHVTRANFEKFGKRFLEVTLKYTAEKLCKYNLNFFSENHLIITIFAK